jgi:hypothetical protein
VQNCCDAMKLLLSPSCIRLRCIEQSGNGSPHDGGQVQQIGHVALGDERADHTGAGRERLDGGALVDDVHDAVDDQAHSVLAFRVHDDLDRASIRQHLRVAGGGNDLRQPHQGDDLPAILHDFLSAGAFDHGAGEFLEPRHQG